jgi:hypothetical protein
MQWFGKHVSTLNTVFCGVRAITYLKNKRRYSSVERRKVKCSEFAVEDSHGNVVDLQRLGV